MTVTVWDNRFQTFTKGQKNNRVTLNFLVNLAQDVERSWDELSRRYRLLHILRYFSLDCLSAFRIVMLSLFLILTFSSPFSWLECVSILLLPPLTKTSKNSLVSLRRWRLFIILCSTFSVLSLSPYIFLFLLLSGLFLPIERKYTRGLRDDQFLILTEDKSSSSLSSNQPKMPLSLILDNIRSSFNVGAIFRTAECLGVLLSPPSLLSLLLSLSTLFSPVSLLPFSFFFFSSSQFSPLRYLICISADIHRLLTSNQQSERRWGHTDIFHGRIIKR